MRAPRFAAVLALTLDTRLIIIDLLVDALGTNPGVLHDNTYCGSACVSQHNNTRLCTILNAVVVRLCSMRRGKLAPGRAIRALLGPGKRSVAAGPKDAGGVAISISANVRHL